MSSPVTVLIIGLNLAAAQRVNPNLKEEDYANIMKSVDTLKSFSGLQYQLAPIDPQLPAEAEESVDTLKKLIRTGPASGNSWTGIFVGSGLRLRPEATPLLEDIVNTVIASGVKSKILFSSTAIDHEAVIKRGFPELS